MSMYSWFANLSQTLLKKSFRKEIFKKFPSKSNEPNWTKNVNHLSPKFNFLEYLVSKPSWFYLVWFIRYQISANKVMQLKAIFCSLTISPFFPTYSFTVCANRSPEYLLRSTPFRCQITWVPSVTLLNIWSVKYWVYIIRFLLLCSLKQIVLSVNIFVVLLSPLFNSSFGLLSLFHQMIHLHVNKSKLIQVK